MVIQRHDVVGTCDSDPIELILHRRLHHHRMTYRRRRLHFSATNDDDVDFRSSVDWTNYYCRRHRHLLDIDDESFVVVAVVAVVVVWKRVSHAYYYSHSRGGPDSISESTMIYGGSRRFHGSLVVVVGC